MSAYDLSDTVDLLQTMFEEALLDGSLVDPGESYVERGVDSLLAAQLADRLSSHLGIVLTAGDLIDAANLRVLASRIAARGHREPAADGAGDADRRSSDDRDRGDDDVVIVAACGRFPGAGDIDALFRMIEARTVAAGRPGDPHRTGSFRAGFLEDADRFDAAFFRISPKEALSIDPQQRLLLEASWHAVEQSGMTLDTLRELNCGVFATGLPGDYRYLLADDPDRAFGAFGFTGNAFSALAGRIAYAFDLSGPAVSLDTACSSALVALAQAHLHLKTAQCQAALVCGASVFSTDEIFRLTHGSSMLSPEGTCKPFSAAADGFAPAEGAGAILLTTRAIARRERLHVLAEVVGAAVRSDGRSNGLMSPNSSGQVRTILAAWRDAGRRTSFDPAEIGYVECHGTGTPIGDPIEIRALAETYGRIATHDPLPLGAIKANIGHALVASGLASILKLVMVLETSRIPPEVPVAVSNPGLAPGRFVIGGSGGKLAARHPCVAVSAFGFTGVNAHVVLRRPEPRFRDLRQDPDAQALPRRADGSLVFVLSAPDEAAIRRLAILMADFITAEFMTESAREWSPRLEDVAAVLWRRRPLKHRVAIAARNARDLDAALRALGAGAPAGVPILVSRGQGAQEGWPDAAAVFVDDGISLPKPDMPALRLPGYPFARDRHWARVEPLPTRVTACDGSRRGPPEAAAATGTRTVAETVAGLADRLTDLLSYAHAEIGPDTRLVDLGLDSLSALRLVEPFRAAGAAIDLGCLFDDAMTVGRLAIRLSGEREAAPTPPMRRDEETEFLMRRLGLVDATDPGTGLKLVTGRGTGRPILLIPPLNTNFRAFIRQIPFLAAHGYVPHLPRLAGHDALPLGERPLSLGEQADAIADYAASLGRPPVLGWSLGGCLALLAETRRPGTFGAMTIVSSAAWFGESLLADAISAQAEFRADPEYFDLVLPGDGSIPRRFGGSDDLRALKAWLDQLAEIDLRDALPSIGCPVLVVNGLRDRVITADRIAPFAVIDGVRLELFETSGHYAPLTEPRAFNRLLADFLSTSRAQPSHLARSA